MKHLRESTYFARGNCLPSIYTHWEKTRYENFHDSLEFKKEYEYNFIYAKKPFYCILLLGDEYNMLLPIQSLQEIVSFILFL